MISPSRQTLVTLDLFVPSDSTPDAFLNLTNSTMFGIINPILLDEDDLTSPYMGKGHELKEEIIDLTKENDDDNIPGFATVNPETALLPRVPLSPLKPGLLSTELKEDPFETSPEEHVFDLLDNFHGSLEDFFGEFPVPGDFGELEDLPLFG